MFDKIQVTISKFEKNTYFRVYSSCKKQLLSEVLDVFHFTRFGSRYVSMDSFSSCNTVRFQLLVYDLCYVVFQAQVLFQCLHKSIIIWNLQNKERKTNCFFFNFLKFYIFFFCFINN